MGNCIFCDVIEGAAPASIVYRDERVCAFLDIQPVNAGHLLVIPTEHAADLADLDPAVGCHLFRIAHRLAAALRRTTLRCEASTSSSPTANQPAKRSSTSTCT